MAKEKKTKDDSAHGELTAAQQKEHHKRQTEAAKIIERQQNEARGITEPSGRAREGNVGARVAYKEGTGAPADVAAHDPKERVGTRGKRSRPQKAP